MKKILGITLIMMLGLLAVGCASTNDITPTEPEEKIEQPAEEEVEKEEPKDEILTYTNEEFKYHMTTTLDDEKYNEYFSSIEGQEVEFDGSIDMMQLLEGKNTRMELLITSGDYSETEVNGPYMKVEDIAYGPELSRDIQNQGTNVKVKAKIEGYDMDRSYLILDIISIEAR